MMMVRATARIVRVSVSSAYLHHLYASFHVVTMRVIYQMRQRHERVIQRFTRSNTSFLNQKKKQKNTD